MKRAVEVKILGQSFIVTSEEREEHLHKVAELVDSKMRELSSSPNAVTTVKVAILTALNIASEYQKLKEQEELLQHAVERLSSRVSEWLED